MRILPFDTFSGLRLHSQNVFETCRPVRSAAFAAGECERSEVDHVPKRLCELLYRDHGRPAEGDQRRVLRLPGLLQLPTLLAVRIHLAHLLLRHHQLRLHQILLHLLLLRGHWRSTMQHALD